VPPDRARADPDSKGGSRDQRRTGPAAVDVEVACGEHRADAAGTMRMSSTAPRHTHADVLARNNVKVSGRGERPMLFVHGFGCDQHMWRFIVPAFADAWRIVLFDHVGHGGSDASGWDARRHASLDAYATDLLEICDALQLEDVVLVGHSVGAMIGALAALREPQRFARLVMVSPSPCYINDGDYVGGFERSDIDGLLDMLDSNYLGWAGSMAPTIMGNAARPALAGELENSFCRTDPRIARSFARVTFLSDNRADLRRLALPTLVLQCTDDVIAPLQVGEYMQRELPDAQLVVMRATGHCPNLSAPEETIAAMRDFLALPA
jgi:sigma-B regulation protein RsbQ